VPGRGSAEPGTDTWPWATETRPSKLPDASPHPGGLQDQLNLEPNNPTLEPGGVSNGGSPGNHLPE